MFFMHSFTAEVSTYDFGKYFYTVAYAPKDVTDDLPMEQYPRLRVDTEIDDMPPEGALMPDRLGSAQTAHLVDVPGPEGQRVWSQMVPRGILDQIEKPLGAEVEVRLRIGDQDAADIPPALELSLRADVELRDARARLPPG